MSAGAQLWADWELMDKVDNRCSTILAGTDIVLFTLEYFNPFLID
jgi:hypothetical protein